MQSAFRQQRSRRLVAQASWTVKEQDSPEEMSLRIHLVQDLPDECSRTLRGPWEPAIQHNPTPRSRHQRNTMIEPAPGPRSRQLSSERETEQE
ncbi:hypothetical protein ZHAS_00016014 [Anopheles sinensis]|uniref:Uncharacterized protein n=1 Tax=Anopheles sinensis TaxID=74873 RepID=A0A084WCL8_ANOSI|nr:hypothetical protein ZHAS_00016014 [Anopheles sinensis]